MLVVALFALGLAAVPLTGGTWRGLSRLRLRHGWLALAALACQLVVLQVPGLPEAVSAPVHVLTYGLAAALVVVNRQVAGLWLLALGAAANGITIALNGGTLPASREAMRTAGLPVEEGFVNSGVVTDPVLPWLGDVFAVPASVPLANVFSIGDVLVVVGAWWMVWTATRRDAPSDRCVPAPLGAERSRLSPERLPSVPG